MPISNADADNKRHWEFQLRDKFGATKTYQHSGPDVPESAVLAHLKEHYRNGEILSLREITPSEFKPVKGIIESHVFDYGILHRLRREGFIKASGKREWDELRRTCVIDPFKVPQPISTTKIPPPIR